MIEVGKGLLRKKNLLKELINFHIVRKESQFRVLIIPGHTKVDEVKEKKITRAKTESVVLEDNKYEKKWTDVWPTRKSSISSLPLPIRMGFVEKSENNSIIPSKYGNAELMKIPNFLHLTHNHVKIHCEKLKNHCSPWPNLEFPSFKVIFSDYLKDGPSLKDERSNRVEIRIDLKPHKLTKGFREKLKKLARGGYCEKDEKEGILKLSSSKCPTKLQNFRYLIFLTTVLFKESFKYEDWEKEKIVGDMDYYDWNFNKSSSNLDNFINNLSEKSNAEKLKRKYGDLVENLFKKENRTNLNLLKDNVKSFFEISHK